LQKLIDSVQKSGSNSIDSNRSSCDFVVQSETFRALSADFVFVNSAELGKSPRGGFTKADFPEDSIIDSLAWAAAIL
jgi:hypothetical protein